MRALEEHVAVVVGRVEPAFDGEVVLAELDGIISGLAVVRAAEACGAVLLALGCLGCGTYGCGLAEHKVGSGLANLVERIVCELLACRCIALGNLLGGHGSLIDGEFVESTVEEVVKVDIDVADYHQLVVVGDSTCVVGTLGHLYAVDIDVELTGVCVAHHHNMVPLVVKPLVSLLDIGLALGHVVIDGKVEH